MIMWFALRNECLTCTTIHRRICFSCELGMSLSHIIVKKTCAWFKFFLGQSFIVKRNLRSGTMISREAGRMMAGFVNRQRGVR